MIERCRSWIQSALEELTTCPSAHNVSLKEAKALLTELEGLGNRPEMLKDDYLQFSQETLAHRCVDLSRALVMSRNDVQEARARRDAMKRKLNEVEGALNVLGTACESLDRLEAAAEAIEERGCGKA